MTGADICSHPCAQEMIDCIDSPVFAEDRATIQALQTTCGSEDAECLPIIADLQDYFNSACCQQTACPDGPPHTCSRGCAGMFLPFWADCGDTLTNIGASQVRFMHK